MMPAVKAPAEKNFRRAKVRPGARKGGAAGWLTWRAGRWALAVTVVLYAGYRATNLVLHASGLQVRRITVHGNVRLSSGEVAAIVDGLQGANILTVDLAGYRHRLLESPWVADVALRRVLPSTVEVFVSERRPMGLCRVGSVLYLVDPRGTLIDEFGPQYSEFDLPIIDGLVRTPSSGQPTIDETRAELASRVIDALAPRKDLAQRVSQIDVRDAHDALVMLDNDPALLHLGEDKFLERLQSYVDLAPALKQRVPDIDYVDLRFDQRVYVRPTGKPTGRQP
jgi:cell division protein FtsQ